MENVFEHNERHQFTSANLRLHLIAWHALQIYNVLLTMQISKIYVKMYGF